MKARSRLAEFQIALTVLTRLPAGSIAPPVPALDRARWAFALVGLVVAVAVWAVNQIALGLGLSPVAAAFFAILALALVTGALHFDGLADCADALGAGSDRERALVILRDSRIGSFGTIALIVAFGLWVAAVARFEAGAPFAVLALASVASRLAMVVVLDLLPPARRDGLGRAAAARGGEDRWRAWLPGAGLLALLAVFLGPAALGALVALALAAALVAWLARVRIGGQTGDVLGAVQVTSEVVCLSALAAMLAGG